MENKTLNDVIAFAFISSSNDLVQFTFARRKHEQN